MNTQYVHGITVNNNVYFRTFNGIYFLIDGEATVTQINNFNFFTNNDLKIDNNKIYVCSLIGSYNTKIDETTATQINGVDENVWTIKIINNDVYFGTDFDAYVLKDGGTNPEQINEVRGKILINNSWK